MSVQRDVEEPSLVTSRGPRPTRAAVIGVLPLAVGVALEASFLWWAVGGRASAPGWLDWLFTPDHWAGFFLPVLLGIALSIAGALTCRRARSLALRGGSSGRALRAGSILGWTVALLMLALVPVFFVYLSTVGPG